MCNSYYCVSLCDYEDVRLVRFHRVPMHCNYFLKIMRDHRVLPPQVLCPNCEAPRTYRSDNHMWGCRKSYPVPKGRKRKCNFSVSDYKRPFPGVCCFEPWKLVLLVYHFLSEQCDHDTLQHSLGLTRTTIIDWRSWITRSRSKARKLKSNMMKRP